MNYDIEFHMEQDRFSFDSFSVLALDRSSGSAAMPVTFKKVVTGEAIVPAMTISEKSAQNLMDELWSVGIRPTEGKGSAGSLAATQSHLEDMRTIAFNRLKIK